jgi:hypothetical protein
VVCGDLVTISEKKNQSVDYDRTPHPTIENWKKKRRIDSVLTVEL